MDVSRARIPCLVAVAIAFLACGAPRSARSPRAVDGYWEGSFMESSGYDFVLVLHFGADTRDRVLLWQDGRRIQNDPLADVVEGGGLLSFRIPAKQTRFRGTVRGDTLTGSFLFPDGSRPPVTVVRVESPRYGDPAVRVAGPEAASIPPEALRADLEFLADQVSRRHPDPWRVVARETWLARVDSIADGIDRPLTPASFLRQAAPLVAAIGCVHTTLGPAERGSPDGLPWVLGRSGDEMVVLAGPSEAPPGSRIVRLDGRSSDEIWARLRAAIPSDGANPWWPVAFADRDLAAAIATWIDDPEEYRVEFILQDGSSRTVKVRAAPGDVRWSLPGGVRFRPRDPDPSDRPAWSRQGGAAVLTLGSFYADDPEAWLKVLSDGFRAIERDGVDRLVIDVRGNMGGFPTLAAEVFRHIARGPFTWIERSGPGAPEAPGVPEDRGVPEAPGVPEDRGAPEDPGVPADLAALYEPMRPARPRSLREVVVLVDGLGVSSTAHLAAHVKASGAALLVGTPTGSGRLTYDASEAFTLPGSGLRLTVATRPFAAAVTGVPDSIVEPDVWLAPTAGDRIAGRDPVLEAALSASTEPPAN